MNCTTVNNIDAKIRSGCYYFPFCNNFYKVEFTRGSYLVELVGASGGFTKFGKVNYPGKGGYVRGILDITYPITMHLYVGGMGKNTTGTGESNGADGGFNGGGKGADDLANDACPTAGGGGATDLRLPSNNDEDQISLRQRIMVAGGGGSAGCWKTAGKGGDGGGIEGQAGDPMEANPLSGGDCGKQTGENDFFGYGEKGEDGVNQGEGAGAGGGGYYGGRGGKSGSNVQSGGGGGGGSSFISGMDGCLAINKNGTTKANSIHFSGIQFREPSTLIGVNYGDGYAIITYLKWCKIQTNIIKYNFYSYFVLLLIIIIQS